MSRTVLAALAFVAGRGSGAAKAKVIPVFIAPLRARASGAGSANGMFVIGIFFAGATRAMIRSLSVMIPRFTRARISTAEKAINQISATDRNVLTLTVVDAPAFIVSTDDEG